MRQRLSLLRQMDRIQFLKHCWTEKYGRVIAKRLINSYRESSSRQAQSVWKTFQTWIPESVKILKKAHVLRFLIYLHESRNLTSRTVLSYRGNLSLPLEVGFNISTKDKTFNLLAKAQFLKKPAPKKSIPKWSLNHALEFFNTPRFHNRNTNGTDAFMKALFLTTLASGNRVSEIAACVREGIVYSNSSITIPVTEKFLFKNQRIDATPEPISFPALNKFNLCPVAALKRYISLTNEMSHNNSLFIHPTSKQPLKAGRISYWLVHILKLATPEFKGKAHELRGQAFSAAWARGVPLKQIIKEGFWVSPNVFINNYLHSTESPTTPFVGGRHICK